LLAEHPAVARAMLNQLAGRLRRTNEVVGDLVFSDVPGRVSKAFLDLATRFGRRADDGIHVNHDLTQEELAQLVGASRETVNKALADFAARGGLRPAPPSVVLLEPDRVHRRARLRGCRTHASSPGTPYLGTPAALSRLIQRLARAIRRRWRKHVLRPRG